MKRRVTLFLLALALAGLCLTPAARAQQVDFGFFYSNLAPYGVWNQSPQFGWVWTPTDVPVGWRPYTMGHWALTDAGNTWVPEEEWGWIPFHYGRWAYDARLGWFWVPDTVWAPAWVAWRSGGGFVGWAPLPPAIGFSVGVGFVGGGFGFADIDADYFTFVPQERCFDPDLRPVFVPRFRNRSFFQATTVVRERFEVRNNRVIDRTFDDDRIRRWTGRVPPRMRVVDDDTIKDARREVVRQNELHIYRPPVVRKFPGQPENRPAPELRRYPGGFDAERQQLQQRQQMDREQLQRMQQRDLEKRPKVKEPVLYRHLQEQNRMEEEHGRERQEIQRRYNRQMD